MPIIQVNDVKNDEDEKNSDEDEKENDKNWKLLYIFSNFYSSIF